MNIRQYPLKKGQYFSDLTAKKFVVWHGTAGRTMHTPVSGRPGKATTSVDAWNLNADRVGAPWLDDWRGFGYFAQMDEAQVDAGIELTLDVCNRHKIEPVFYYPSTTFDFPRCFQVATIICHSNCRADKTDLCLPQWVFDKIAAAGIRIAS